MLGETIREKLLEKINLLGDPYVELKRLFEDIDRDNSNRLSRMEFETLMDMLHINFSRNKWKQIYHEIDRNYDDQVSFEEFILFLFPNHDVAKAMEVKRIKIIRKRLADRVAKQSGKNYLAQEVEKDDDDDSVDGGSSKFKVTPLPAISSSAIDVGDDRDEGKNGSSGDTGAAGGRSQKVVTFASNSVEHILHTDSDHH